jgi:Pyruvate/2-oxoacid:ferredoxin oxidoreductase delta subunit
VLGNPTKDYILRNQGRLISKEQALSFLDLGEKEGLVIQTGNAQDLFCVCLCCGCCCEALQSAKKFPKPAEQISSNYYAEILSDRCINCKICQKRCQMEAIILIESKMHINLDRCIGCGLCVPSCKKNAIHLNQKTIPYIPPKDASDLYIKMLKRRLTPRFLARLIGKLITGKPI